MTNKDITITTDNQITPKNNDEILYRVSERNPINLVFGECLIYTVMLLVSLVSISSHNIGMKCFGIALTLIVLFFSILAITFKEIVVYKNRIVIKRKLFGESIINIYDIKKIDLLGRFSDNGIVIQPKTNYFSRLKYIIVSLHQKDVDRMQELIQTLKTGDKQ